MTDITSLQNERVKLAHALQTQAKARRREGKLVVEGVRLLNDALNCGLMPEYVFYLGSEATLDRLAYKLFRRLNDLNAPFLSVSAEVMAHVTDLETPPGILAVLPRPDLPAPESPSLVLALDGINNPGNLGSVLRTAAAAGADLVILAPGTVDPYNPKVLRGGMGAHFRLPLVQATWPDIAARYGHLNTYLAEASGETPYYAVDWLRPSMIIVGGEAHGAGAAARQVAGRTITIPMAAQTESLNAAVAAGIILYEVQRQRHLSAQEGARP